MTVKDDAAKRALEKVKDASLKKELETVFSKQEEKYAKLESKLTVTKAALKKLFDSL